MFFDGTERIGGSPLRIEAPALVGHLSEASIPSAFIRR